MARTIAVAGKGGTGKTTIAALMVQCLCESKQGPVLAVDADPDANLGTLLGVEPEKTLGDLREEILADIRNIPAGMAKADYVQAGLHQIVEEAVGFDLLTMGRGEGPGCYCSLNNLIRRFTEELAPSYRWLVMDNEAGLEHLSRRTTSGLDALVMVVTGNPISHTTAERIVRIADTLKNGIRQKYVIANTVSEEQIERVKERVAHVPARFVGTIPVDPALEEALFDTGSLKGLRESAAKEKIRSIVDMIGGQDNGSA
jgi:CO dehydrogenase maturation factor